MSGTASIATASIVGATAPDPPVLTGFPGITEASLTWTTPADGGSPITGYNVYRGLAPGGELLLVALGVTNSYLDTGLTNGVTYYYEVTAVNAVGESGFSNEVSVVPAAVVPPGAPTLDTAVAGIHTVALAWTAGFDGGSPITAYKIYRGTVSGGEVLVATVGAVLSYLDLGRTTGITYFYKVTATNIAGEGPLSNELSATPVARPAPSARFFQGYPWRFLFTDIPATSSNNVLKANAAVTDAFVEFDFDVPQSDVWISFLMFIPTAAFTDWTSGGNSASLFGIGGGGGSNDIELNGAIAGGSWWDGYDGTGTPATPDQANRWLDCEVHWVGGLIDFYIDGVLILSSTTVRGDAGGFGPGVSLAPATTTSVVYFDNVKAGVARHGSELFNDNFQSGNLSDWTATSGNVTVIPDPFSGSDGGVTTTWANGLLTSRSIVYSLDQPTVISASVWPDNRNVNAIFEDGDPLIAQGNRLVYCFRREGGTHPWKIRAAGILMSPEDQGDADVPLTHFVAYDAWQYLQARPVMFENGELPPPDGAVKIATGDVIAREVLKATIDNQGFAFIDAGAAYGGTAFYSGHIDTTDEIVVEYQRGMSVADLWSMLCDSGNMDIVLTAIYDPRRPGYTHQLNIYNLAGNDLQSVVFGWDKLNHASTTADRMHDGTPGNFINVIQAYAGQGGFPVPAAGPLENNASVLKYLPYWLNQFQASQGAVDPTGSLVLALAQQQLTLAKQGKRTMTLTPTPERAPVPLTAYTLGDRPQVYTTNRLRVASAGPQRIQSIPITITDDGIEQVAGLLCSPDWRRWASVLTPDTGSAGDPITVTVGGFYGGANLIVRVGSTLATIVSGDTADAGGNSTIVFDIPAVSPGTYNVSVTSTDGSATSHDPLVVS